MKRTYLLAFFAYAFAVFGSPLRRLTDNPDFVSIWLEFTLQGFGIMFICLIFYNFALFVGHLVHGLYYKFHGYGMPPILLYPILFNGNRRSEVKLFKNFLFMVEPFYPRKLYQDNEIMEDDHKLSKLCQTGHKYMLSSQILFYVILMILFLIHMKMLFVISCALMIGVFLSLALSKTNNYHGVIVRNRFMEEGFAPIYLSKQLILYSNDNHPLYLRFERLLEKDMDHNFLKFIVEIIKQMYMIKCINPNFVISPTTEQYTEENLMMEHASEVLGVGCEKFDFMKVYLCYSMITNDIAKKNIVLYWLESIAAEFAPYSRRGVELYYWYINIGSNNYIGPQENRIYKNKILRPNGFLSKFNNYDYDYRTITEKITSMCNKDG
jgi:hypothetical protein